MSPGSRREDPVTPGFRRKGWPMLRRFRLDDGLATLTRFRLDDGLAALTRPRALLGVGFVVCIALVVAVARPFGPPAAQGWVTVAGVLAVIAAIQTVASDPRDLKTAMLLALPAVVALALGSAWLVGPMATLLLVAAELNTLSSECQDADRLTDVQRKRLRSVAGLAAVAGVASVVVAVGI